MEKEADHDFEEENEDLPETKGKDKVVEEEEEEEKEEEDGQVYYGERMCEGKRKSSRTGKMEPCTNKAYYAQPVGRVPSASASAKTLTRHLKPAPSKKRKAEAEEEEEEEEERVEVSGDEGGDDEADGDDGDWDGGKMRKRQKNENEGTKEKKAKMEGKVQYLCGVHAKNKAGRRELPKRSAKDKKRQLEQRMAAEKAQIEIHRQRNQAEGKRGDVVLERLRMMRAPQAREGYLRVYPNYKHQNKADGYGCMRLSPMSLGPVEHGQPGLPPALNIENFHQGTKVFTQETDGKRNPTKVYEQNRLRFYKDPVPHRHKYKGKDKSGNKNIPLYFLWIDREGKEHRLSYIQSRQFYCNFYERLASKEPDWEHLLQLMKDGTNLQICGYDAEPLRPGQTVEQAYLDPSTPFGHERVLYTMLLYHDEPEKYPWRIHKTFDF